MDITIIVSLYSCKKPGGEENLDNDKKQISIVIPNSMYEWLEKHKEINRSEIFRQAVKKIQSPSKNKVSPLMFLATIMGIVFSICLIGISTTIYLRPEINAVVALLGGILAVSASMLYYKERRRLRAL